MPKKNYEEYEKYQKGPDQGEIVGRVAVVLLVLAAVASLLLPLLLGVLLFFLLYRYTPMARTREDAAADKGPSSRKRFAVLWLVATAASVFSFTAGWASEYFGWLLSLTTLGSGDPLQIPWLALASYSAFVAGMIGTLGVDWIRAHTPDRVAETLRLDSAVDSIHVDPNRAQKIISKAKPPTSLTETTPSRHGPDNPDAEAIVVGTDPHNNPVKIYAHDLSMHGMVLGTTGSGKTVTLLALLEGMLDLGYNGCVLDLKEDIGEGGLADFLESYAASHTKEFQHWALSYDEEDFAFYFDPMFGLDVDLAVNMITSMQDFEAPHWEAMCKQVLGQLLHLMYTAHQVAPEKFPAPSLRDVGRILSGDLHNDTQAMRATVLSELKDTGQFDESDIGVLTNPSQDHRQASKGLGARISAAYESHAGRTGLRPSPKRKPLRLDDSGIVYVGLDSLGKKDTSRVVSSAVLAGYSALASRRKDNPRVKSKQDRRFLVIDEAASVNTDMVKNLLSRARSSGITVILATQGAVDWEDDWNAMVNNTNFSVIMGQQDFESARRAAELIGTEVKTDESQSLEGGEVIRTSQREVEDYRVPPEELRGLQRGQAMFRVRERYGQNVPFLTWMYVFFRQRDKTADTHKTSVERRTQRTSNSPFSKIEKALPNSGSAQPENPGSQFAAPPGFGDGDPSEGSPSAPPAPRRPAPRKPQGGAPPSPPKRRAQNGDSDSDGGGWNPA